MEIKKTLTLILCLLFVSSCSKIPEMQTNKSLPAKVADSNITNIVKSENVVIDEVPQIEPEIYKEVVTSEDISMWGDGCSWFCGAPFPRISASSFLPKNESNDYKAENIFDNKLEIAWIDGNSSYGIGEYIEFNFISELDDLGLTQISLFNGYQKSEKIWKDNSRVAKLLMYVNQKPYAVLHLMDTKQMQTFEFNEAKLEKNKDFIVRLEIVDVYKGDRYSDTAISEIDFSGTGVH